MISAKFVIYIISGDDVILSDDKHSRADKPAHLIFRFHETAGVHKSFHPTIRDGSTWSKFGARGEHGDVLRFSTEVFSGSPT